MKKLISWPVIINAGLFQLTWFACVIGSAQNQLWPAFVFTAGLAAWQLHPKRRHPSDLRLIAAAVVLGLIVDSIWASAGLMDFKQHWPSPSIAPAWIILLWISFALTINHSLMWLTAHPLLPALMGLVGGPLSYLAGLRLGAVEYLDDPLLISAYVGIAWSLSMMILVKLGQGHISSKSRGGRAANSIA